MLAPQAHRHQECALQSTPLHIRPFRPGRGPRAAAPRLRIERVVPRKRPLIRAQIASVFTVTMASTYSLASSKDVNAHFAHRPRRGEQADLLR